MTMLSLKEKMKAQKDNIEQDDLLLSLFSEILDEYPALLDSDDDEDDAYDTEEGSYPKKGKLTTTTSMPTLRPVIPQVSDAKDTVPDKDPPAVVAAEAEGEVEGTNEVSIPTKPYKPLPTVRPILPTATVIDDTESAPGSPSDPTVDDTPTKVLLPTSKPIVDPHRSFYEDYKESIENALLKQLEEEGKLKTIGENDDSDTVAVEEEEKKKEPNYLPTFKPALLQYDEHEDEDDELTQEEEVDDVPFSTSLPTVKPYLPHTPYASHIEEGVVTEPDPDAYDMDGSNGEVIPSFLTNPPATKVDTEADTVDPVTSAPLPVDVPPTQVMSDVQVLSHKPTKGYYRKHNYKGLLSTVGLLK